MPRADYRCTACHEVIEFSWAMADEPPHPFHWGCKHGEKSPQPMERVWSVPLYVHVKEKVHVGNALGRSHDYTTREYDDMMESWPRTVAEREADDAHDQAQAAKQAKRPIEVD